tara:strand:- start:46 stop:603 length:558 start_codon:yes stop_codon:yes gene_type:complete
MKKILLILILAQGINSCKKYDLEIKPEYRVALNYISKKKIIYFENQFKDLDTIKIIGLDSIREVPIIGNTHPHKTINLRIEHLPKNNWKEIQLYGDPTKPKPQAILSIDNSFEKCCNITIQYRDFIGTIYKKENLDLTKNDTIYSDITDMNLTENSVTTVYWNMKKGVVGYEKKNGEIYKVKNAP